MARFVRVALSGNSEAFVNVDQIRDIRLSTLHAGKVSLFFDNNQTLTVDGEPREIVDQANSP
jgi:hypothetical protein